MASASATCAGASDKRVIRQPKELEFHGVILRTVYRQSPPRVDYALTPFGRRLVETLVPLCEGVEKNTEAIAAGLVKQEKAGSSRYAISCVCAADARLIAPRGVVGGKWRMGWDSNSRLDIGIYLK